MILFPPAKINLGLYVHRRRDDGYHEIESCMNEIPLFDALEILPSNEFRFVQTGIRVDGEVSDNICVKAFRLIQHRFALPDVYIHLRKNIPVGAGLGGGSSDAAYVLKGVRSLFNLEVSDNVLEEMAAELGSDCAFFIKAGTQLSTGRGEVLTPIRIGLEGYFLKVVNPGLHVRTAEAYAEVELSSCEGGLTELLQQPVENWKGRLHNSFEKSVFRKYPALAAIKEKLYAEGASYALMSGSGSTVFGLFKNEPDLTFPDYFEKVMKL